MEKNAIKVTLIEHILYMPVSYSVSPDKFKSVADTVGGTS